MRHIDALIRSQMCLAVSVRQIPDLLPLASRLDVSQQTRQEDCGDCLEISERELADELSMLNVG